MKRAWAELKRHFKAVMADDSGIFWAPLIGAAVGAAKHAAVDVPREQRSRRLAAETQRYSPWTGMQAQPIQEANLFGSALQGGVTGAQLGQAEAAQTQQADQMKAFEEAEKARRVQLQSMYAEEKDPLARAKYGIALTQPQMPYQPQKRYRWSLLDEPGES
jgi:hypothetical protein